MPRSPVVTIMFASFHDGGIFLSMRATWRRHNPVPAKRHPRCPGRIPGRRDIAGSLLVFVKSRLGRTGQIQMQIECFDACPVETTAVDCRACTAGGQEGPFGCQIAMEDLVRPDGGDLQPRAPFSRTRMKARTASTWPSATSSAAVRWPSAHCDTRDCLVDVAGELRRRRNHLDHLAHPACRRSDDRLRSVLRWTLVNCARLATFTQSARDRRFGLVKAGM